MKDLTILRAGNNNPEEAEAADAVADGVVRADL